MSIALPNTAPQVPVFVEGEILNCEASFDAVLEASETLAGTPTIAELYTTDLTITSPQVNATALTINGATVAEGRAVQWTMTGQKTSAALYTLSIMVATTMGALRIKLVQFRVGTR